METLKWKCGTKDINFRLEAKAKAGGASAGLSFQIDCSGQDDAEGETF